MVDERGRATGEAEGCGCGALSPGKRNLTLYIMPGFDGCQALLAKLGKHRTGRSCLYVNRLRDIDISVLEQIIRHSVAEMCRRYPLTSH